MAFSNSVSSYASSSDHNSLMLLHFLKNNLKNVLISSFEDFLQDVFEFKPNNNINLEKICRDDTTCSLFRIFLSSLTKPECNRFEPFTNLANHMSSLIAVEMHRECSIFAWPHDAVSVRNSSGVTRYPDVVFASKSPTLQGNPLDWSDVKLVLKFKAKFGGIQSSELSIQQSNIPSTPSRVSTSDNAPSKSPRTRASKISLAALQLAAYALKSFIHGPYCSHVVHGTIQESMLELWYYDRVGAVRSSGVDFSKNLVLLAQFLMAIGHLSEASWGLHPRITYPQLTPLSRSLRAHPKLPTPDDEGSSLDIKSKGSAHDSRDQSGPESQPGHPFDGATITVQDRTFVLSDCVSQQYSLVRRGTCVIEADGGTVVIKLSWPEKTRTLEYEFLKRAYTSTMEYDNGKYARMKNHLPVLEVKEDFGEWGHRWLYRVMGILHGDINMNNIMICRDGAKVVSILIDYDLAIDINKPLSTSLE
ncbi:hypothetical protein BS47DRAFT_1450584 [Hydnum rufescens UP504]|uniref:Fungal-type protein kinase domain-containing protein n=1 Tax=Hydnum rufescens UP504 TaxID=1448309 RepID=A0A9P6DXK3_9AGAM|nr:hypothetical protein BS47DRAFT_1450584 [Hydnum rufescens UP504]